MNVFFPFSGYQNYMLDFEIPQNFTLIQDLLDKCWTKTEKRKR